MKKYIVLLITLLTITACQDSEKLLLHVPSPAWEDQIIYFIMTDRFFDGNPANNELGEGEYDPTKNTHFNGGDLVGIQQQLDYIEELGATAIWITPPVLNQWWNPDHNFTGYHGYWASHFEKVDPHYGNLEDYKRLSDALHRRGMYLVQDVVTNHTGDYMRYEGGYDSVDVAKFYVNYGAPEQPPFDLNDPANPAHREAAIYHFTPTIADFTDWKIRVTHQMADLDDLNTTNPKVVEALIKAYQYWIETVGVDAYRFDTAIYVENEFWNRFVHAGEGNLKGIFPFAKTTGREQFYTFGETWVTAPPMDDSGEMEMKAYLGTTAKPEMGAVLNFPLQQSIKRVFADGEPTVQMAYRLSSLQRHFPDPTTLVNFIDNHDMVRFRALATEESFRQAMLFLMSIPGVPVLYQGSEQGEKESRAPLFNKLDTSSAQFIFSKKMMAFRKENELTRKGEVRILADSDRCPGLLVYRLEKDGEELYVAFNTQENNLLTGDIFFKNDTLANGVAEVISLQGGSKMVMDRGKMQQLYLPPKEGVVFKIQKGEPENPGSAEVRVFNPTGVQVETPTLFVRGSVIDADSVFVMLDGNLDGRIQAAQKEKTWEAEFDFKNQANGPHFWQAVAIREGRFIISKKVDFVLELPEIERAVVRDRTGDDRGPTGRYEYPSDPTFAPRTMDIKKVSAFTTGNNLRLAVEMAEPLSTVWSPHNGFDHLLLMAFIDLPEKDGMAVLPKMNMEVPDEGEWDLGMAANGWRISMFGTEGAGAEAYGRAVSQKPRLRVIPENNTIELLFAASLLGLPSTLDGATIHLYTWDSGGDEEGLRPLAPKPDGFTFGGGEEDGPKYMDKVTVELK